MKYQNKNQTVSMLMTNGQSLKTSTRQDNFPTFSYVDKICDEQQSPSLTFAQVKLARPQFKGSVEDYVMITNFKRFKRKGSSSKYKGVFYVKKEKKYRAQICLKGKKQYVGTFSNDFDAAVARDNRIRERFGEVEELLNFPNPQNEINHSTNAAMTALSEQQFFQTPFTPHHNFKSFSKTLNHYGSSGSAPTSFGMNFESAMYNQMFAPYLTQADFGVQPAANLPKPATDSSFLFTGPNYHLPSSRPDTASFFHSSLLLPEYLPHTNETEPPTKRVRSA